MTPNVLTPDQERAALAPDPTPVQDCPTCREEHWRCVWCLRHDVKTRSGRGGKVVPSAWEQQRLKSDDWSTLCTRCAAKRMRNPYNALLPMRIRGTGEGEEP